MDEEPPHVSFIYYFFMFYLSPYFSFTFNPSEANSFTFEAEYFVQNLNSDKIQVK
jgi:hypothetical protein